MVRQFLDVLVPGTLHLYTRLCHGCTRVGPNPVPARGPALVIANHANHANHADPAFLMAACGRWIHFLQAREYHEVFLLRRFFRLVGCIPVTRGGRDRSAIRGALECLRRGEVVGLFPEGEVAEPGRERLRPGKTGAALLALRSGAPVIPAFIAGAPPARGVAIDWVWPARAVCVHFGPPVDLAAYAGEPITHARLREVTDLFMRRIADLDPARPPQVSSRGRATSAAASEIARLRPRHHPVR